MPKNKKTLADLAILMPPTTQDNTPPIDPSTITPTSPMPGGWIKYTDVNDGNEYITLFSARIVELSGDWIVLETNFRPSEPGKGYLSWRKLDGKKYALCSSKEGEQIRQASIARLQSNADLAALLRPLRDEKLGGFGCASENDRSYSSGGWGSGRNDNDRDGFLSPNYD